ncbi:MAG: glycoside hydrolase family 5 protein [Verrucomicrobiota bacterium]
MMPLKKIRIPGLAIFLTCCMAAAEGWSAPPTAAEMSVRMGAGINLGNVFDAPGGEGTWRKLPAQEWEFEAFKSAGFHHVRLPVTWGAHLSTNAPFTVDKAFLDRVAQVVGWANQHGLVVVLNAMHEEWFKKDPEVQAARFDALWAQIATAFKSVPDDQLVFEVLNESEKEHISDAQTDAMNARIVKVVRGISPTRCVIVAAVGDNAGRLREGKMHPPRDPYVLASFHSYDPWSFCSAGTNTWGSEADENWLVHHEPDFAALQQWSATNRCPLYMGEFGTSSKVDPACRVKYYSFYTRQARERGFSFAVWDDGGDMAIFDRSTRSWTPGIVEAVMQK